MLELLDALRISGVLLMVALNAFFVAAEFALVTVRWTRVEELVSEGRFGATAVRQAIENLNDTIAASQVGITLASLTLGWVGEPALSRLIEPSLTLLFPGESAHALSRTVGAVLSFSVLTFFHIVFGEQVPKSLAIQNPEGTALALRAANSRSISFTVGSSSR